MKKLLSKIAHDLPKTFFFSIDNQPKIDFHIMTLFKTYVTPDDSTTKAPKPKKGAKEMQSM